MHLSWSTLGSCEGGEEQRGTTQGKVVGAQKDIHQQREESSRAKGMLASRAKSESFAYKVGQSRTRGTRKRTQTAAQPVKYRVIHQSAKKKPPIIKTKR